MRLTTISLLVAAIPAIGLAACSGDKTAAGEAAVATPVETLRSRLLAIDSCSGVMFGHHDDPVYGYTWTGDTGRSDVLEVVGDYPAMMSWDLGAIELGRDNNLDGVPFDRIRAEVAAQDARGGFNTFSWHLYSPVDSSDCWTIGDSLTVQRILTDSVVHAAYEHQLDRVADFFNSLTDADGNKIAVIFRPWHEHTGGWFWWGRPYCTPDEYRELWLSTRRGLEERGVDNLLYAYSPDRVTSEEDYMERYPGDDAVDIMGIDIYQFDDAAGTDTYRRAAELGLSVVCEAAAEHGKIAAFTETGLEGLRMDDWYTTVLLPLLKAHPVAYVVVWRNSQQKPGHFYAPYPGHPSASDFKKFYDDSTTLFVNNLK